MSSGRHRIVLAGGSGFVGTSLSGFLQSKGYDVAVLTRSTAKPLPDVEYVQWDGRTLDRWASCLDGARAIVNLAGSTINCVKTPESIDNLLRSRVEATQVLGAAIRSVSTPPPTWVQMTTAHIVGDPPSVLCDENSPNGIGMGPTVGQRWEEAFFQSALPNQQKIILRISLVLGKDRGAGQGVLGPLRLLSKLFLGGRAGSGKQGFSWIHELDLNRLVERALTDSTMSGIYIASSPSPVSQSEFMIELRKVLRVPFGLPASEWMVRFGARYLFKSDADLILYGRYVKSTRLEHEGFEFLYPKLDSVLKEIFTE